MNQERYNEPERLYGLPVVRVPAPSHPEAPETVVAMPLDRITVEVRDGVGKFRLGGSLMDKERYDELCDHFREDDLRAEWLRRRGLDPTSITLEPILEDDPDDEAELPDGAD